MIRKRRFTIGGLMWLTFIVCFSLAALRNAAAVWAGVVFLVTCGVLGFAVIAAVCRPASERAWWLGFTVFGGGYLWLALWGPQDWRSPALPATEVLKAVAPVFNVSLAGGVFGGLGEPQPREGDLYLQIGHCLWSLLFATAGGLWASAFPGLRSGPAEAPVAPPQPPDDQRPLRWWCRPATVAFGGSLLLVLFTLAGYPSNPELLSGVSYLLTCTLVGAAVLGAALARTRRRAEWFGAALFGGCYLIFHLAAVPGNPTWSLYRPTDSVVAVFRPALISGVRMLHGAAPANDPANFQTKQKLEQVVSMSFPNETPLEDVMKYVKTATQGPNDSGLRFYIDPASLQEAEKTMQSPVQIDVEGAPLKATLPLILKQLGLGCFIRNGLLIITTERDVEGSPEDPYVLIGHCILTGLAAGLGSLLVLFFTDARRKEPATPA